VNYLGTALNTIALILFFVAIYMVLKKKTIRIGGEEGEEFTSTWFLFTGWGFWLAGILISLAL
jgi:hypothetical protein